MKQSAILYKNDRFPAIPLGSCKALSETLALKAGYILMKPAFKKDDLHSVDMQDGSTMSLAELLQARHASVGDDDEVRSVEVVTGFDDTVRWPLWKTGALIISVCLIFWIGVAALIMYAIG